MVVLLPASLIIDTTMKYSNIRHDAIVMIAEVMCFALSRRRESQTYIAIEQQKKSIWWRVFVLVEAGYNSRSDIGKLKQSNFDIAFIFACY